MDCEHEPHCVTGYPELCPTCVEDIRDVILRIAKCDDDHDIYYPDDCDPNKCGEFHGIRRGCVTYLMEQYQLDIDSINLAVATHRHDFVVPDNPNEAPEVFHLPIDPERA